MKNHTYYLGWIIHVMLAVLLIEIAVGCASDPGSELSQLQVKDPCRADPFDVVDCLLPGQIRQLGTMVTYLTERRPIRTTAEDYAIRGGEYVALDRADYGTALTSGGVKPVLEEGGEGHSVFATAAINSLV